MTKKKNINADDSKITKNDVKGIIKFISFVALAIILLAKCCKETEGEKAVDACLTTLYNVAAYGTPEVYEWKRYGDETNTSHVVIHAKMQNAFGTWSRETIICYPSKQSDGSYIGII